MEQREITKLAFFGPASSGKTWSANYLVSRYGFKRVAFADKLKEIAYELFGVQGKNGADRKLLQDLGQKMREINPNVWVDYVLEDVKKQESWEYPPEGFVLDDLRYVNESFALRKAGFQIIYVSTPVTTLEWRRSTLYPDTPLSSYYHDSEQEWKQIAADYTVEGGDPVKGATHLDILMEQLNGIRTTI